MSSTSRVIGPARALRLLGAVLVMKTAAVPLGIAAVAQEVTFRHAIDNAPLDVAPQQPGEKLPPQVMEFRKTGRNPYNGSQDALTEGKTVYETFCQSCHMPDGSGRMGASLIGPNYTHERIRNDVGLFEVIFGGAFGAMQPFSKHITQDEILKVMAYTRTLMKQ